MKKTKSSIYKKENFKKLVEEFDSELIFIAGAPEEEVEKIGYNNAEEYLRILKELSLTVSVAFRKIIKTFGIDDTLYEYKHENNKFSNEKIYQNQIDTLKKNLERKNAGRKRNIEKKGIQISNDNVIEKRKKGMIIKDIAKETGLSIATINRIIRKQNKT